MRMIMYYLISSNHSANTCLIFCNYNSNFLSAQNPAVHLNKSSQTWNINHMWFVVSISPFRLLILDHLQYSTLPVYHKSDCVYPIQLLNKRPAMSDTFVEPHTLAHICQQFANLINSYLIAPVPSSFSMFFLSCNMGFENGVYSCAHKTLLDLLALNIIKHQPSIWHHLINA